MQTTKNTQLSEKMSEVFGVAIIPNFGLVQFSENTVLNAMVKVSPILCKKLKIHVNFPKKPDPLDWISLWSVEEVFKRCGVKHLKKVYDFYWNNYLYLLDTECGVSYAVVTRICLMVTSGRILSEAGVFPWPVAVSNEAVLDAIEMMVYG